MATTPTPLSKILVFTPARPIQVSPNKSIAGLFETNQNDSFISFQASGTTASSTVRIGAVADNFVAFVNGGERLRIASDGKILMGVAANNGPAAPLHIYGGSNTTPILAFTRSSTHDDWQGGGIGLVDEGGTYKGASGY